MKIETTQSSRLETKRHRATRHEERNLEKFLDACCARLQLPSAIQYAPNIIRALNIRLEATRQAVSDTAWRERIAPSCRNHKIASILAEDPYTSRALEKPRGFAGDAVLLDYIYKGANSENISALGQAITTATAGSPNGLSVVDRRDRLTAAIEHAAATRRGCGVLAIACGHLREVEQLRPATRKQIGRIVALDQDPRALEVAATSDDGDLVVPIEANVRDLIAKRLDLADFSLVYAAGLFDYLTDFVATRLLKSMFSITAPGGRLLIGNFTPNNSGRAYMEAFMDWHLEYRTTTDMRRIGRESFPENEVAVERIYTDSLENIAYIDVTKV